MGSPRILAACAAAIFLCAPTLRADHVRTTPAYGAPAAPARELNGRATEWAAGLLQPVQSLLSSNFVAAVDRLDRTFGDDRLIEDAATSRLLLGVGVRTSRSDGGSFEHRTRASVALPRMRHRAVLLWDQLTESEDPADRDRILDAYEDTKPDLELRLHLLEPTTTRLSAGAGVRLGSGAQAYGRLRGSAEYALGRDTGLYVAQTLRHFSEDGTKTTSEARLTWSALRRWVLRAHPRVDWAEEEPGYKPMLTFSALRYVGRVQAVRFDVGGAWPETPHTRESRYHVQCTQRWLLGREWLLGELATGVAFPERESFRADPYVGVMVEIVFGNGR